MSQRRITKVSQLFSVPILLRTLFAPWRRIVTPPGTGIDAHMRAMGDNMISRTIGFIVRVIVLCTAGIGMLFMTVVGGLELLLWPLVPPMILVALVMGVIG
jgi:hypothetical protein